jgi:hypothetical protein
VKSEKNWGTAILAAMNATWLCDMLGGMAV